MAGGQERESPRRELTSKEQGGVHKEGNASTPLAPLTQGELSWYERPHEELVKGFQDYIQEKGKLFGGRSSPVEIIRMRLYEETNSSLNREKMSFFFPLRVAWDALTYHRYEPGSFREYLVGSMLQSEYKCSHEPAIKLSHPLQVRVIDSLTEAVGIPHQKGQAVIEIPEKLRDYDKWVSSKEYKERVAKAKAKK
jgi:hypothetical protein